MEQKIKPRPGFETGGKIRNAKEWEELDYYWMDKSFEQRMNGLWDLIELYLDMNNLPKSIDRTVGGKREPKHVSKRLA